jgi:hypothetical protein
MDTRRVEKEPTTAPTKEEMRPLNPAAMELEAPAGGLSAFPPVERWEDWVEYDPAAWPRKVEKHYTLVVRTKNSI